MKITFIATLLNEEENIEKLLDSLLAQTKLPSEIIIVDAGSTDQTNSIIKNYELRFKQKNIKFRLLIKKGNRSVGRNEAIKKSSGNIIVCSDAGCILDKNWVDNISKPFNDSKVDVVAGYYEGIYKNVFEKCLIPYVLVMPDKVDPDNFLPATRSIAFRKSIWKKVGGFPEKLSYSEDYFFARKLKKSGNKIVFQKNAIAKWIPRKNFIEAFKMFFRFAKGDIEAGILRPKVVLVFIRYISVAFILVWNIKILLVLLVLYCIWAISKNYKYVQDARGIIILPFLQVTADLAVVSGSLNGFLVWVIEKK